MTRITFPFWLVLLALICGCGTASVDVVDLNKVLDLFAESLAELDGDKPANVTAESGDETGSQTVVGIESVAAEDESKTESFIALFRTKLGDANLVSTPIGVKIEDSGTIHGFADPDNDNVMGAGEKSLFKIDIDDERNRVVATDGGGHYRDHHYRGGGIMTGYLLGRMMSSSRGYFSGARATAKPDYGKTKMSAPSYHASAVSKARASARTNSARSRSGSRGMSFGK